LRHFLAQPVDLLLLRLHLTMAGKRMLSIGSELPDPLAQHVLVEIQITGSLRNSNAPILHQPHRLKLELAAELPSQHSHSPVPLNTLSRCPRNRQQAIFPTLTCGHERDEPSTRELRL